ncbi:hypothetical protein HDU98_004379 [Podochytrium sp. JEL0797]|nr:hypothetical protein HDU98_004379 [Podochytrium sp. JEL0797]
MSTFETPPLAEPPPQSAASVRHVFSVVAQIPRLERALVLPLLEDEAVAIKAIEQSGPSNRPLPVIPHRDNHPLYRPLLPLLLPPFPCPLLPPITLNLHKDTLITNCPAEVVAQILSWIRPKKVWKFRRLSKAFRACISSPAFARLNFIRCFRSPDPAVDGSFDPTRRNVLYLKAPETYQTAYIQRFWKFFKTISWGREETFYALDIGIPIALMDCKFLVELHIEWYSLTGEIPDEIGLLQSLEFLNFANNALEGLIPAGIGRLKKLRVLALEGNRLQGPIPRELGQCCGLTSANLCMNEALDGCLPAELGNLTRLEYLDVSNCALSGEIPREFGQLANLKGLFLGCNSLMGEVPVELTGLKELTKLYLQGNAGFVCSFEFGEDVELTL